MPKAKKKSAPLPLARPIVDPIFAAIENHRKLEKAWLALANAPECAGIAARRSRAESAWWRAALQMARTKPRTPAGAEALLAYTKREMFEVGEMEWHQTALDTVIESLAAMETAPPRSPGAAALLAAVRAEKDRRQAAREGRKAA